jgi:diadenosine tetraphosphatase ApaH/serine/threonine PP2A family protein phosphatase
MRSAILSDIHANLIAFQAFLDAVDRLHVHRAFCLGDIVGYNPWPNECVQIIRERSIPCIMGNHDRVAAGLEEPDNFNALAREAIHWTRGVLTQANRSFLAKLPDRRAIDSSAILVHGSPRDPDEYILTTAIARENMAFMRDRLGSDLCFFGHTHVSGIFDGLYDNAPIAEGTFSLKRGRACLVNPGSIGQPRDRDPRASFLIYDDENMTVEFHRVDYDVGAVKDAIVREGLPPHLGRRLFLGT